MSHARMYRQGEKIGGLDELVAGAAQGRWVWVPMWGKAGKPTHPHVLMSMTVSTVKHFLNSRSGLFWAADNERHVTHE